MQNILSSKEATGLRQEIISQCVWSETYSSLKHILKRTANQLPLLITFANDDNEEVINGNSQTILFFDRNLSNKLLFTPLEQRADQPESFDIHPKSCTFAITDGFKGKKDNDKSIESMFFPPLQVCLNSFVMANVVRRFLQLSNNWSHFL